MLRNSLLLNTVLASLMFFIVNIIAFFIFTDGEIIFSIITITIIINTLYIRKLNKNSSHFKRNGVIVSSIFILNIFILDFIYSVYFFSDSFRDMGLISRKLYSVFIISLDLTNNLLKLLLYIICLYILTFKKKKSLIINN